MQEGKELAKPPVGTLNLEIERDPHGYNVDMWICVFTVHSVCAAERGTECVRAARSQCPRQCVFFGQVR